MLVLGLQLWRSFGLEAQLQQTEVERALLLGERILQRTVRSRDAFAAVSPTSRFVVRGGRIQVDEQVAWLHPIAAEVDQDAIVLDRLDRASHAEFVQHDQAAAQAEFDELLAGPLVFAQRLQVVSAALWQAKRAACTSARACRSCCRCPAFPRASVRGRAATACARRCCRAG